MRHTYDITKSFEENAINGPFWEGKYPEFHADLPKNYVLFGKKIISPLGVAACPLMVNANYIELMSNVAYGFYTYKSVRAVAWAGNEFPHWKYIDAHDDFSEESLQKTVTAQFNSFNNKRPSMVNSFGVQSKTPEEWIPDVNAAKQHMHDGQLLLLSLMFTAVEGRTFVEDARLVAEHGNKTDADAFEINLAHPNTKGSLIYEDVDMSTAVCLAARKSLGTRKLIAKVGYYHNTALLRKFMEHTQGIIDGISSTNTYSMSVTDVSGVEAFPGRPTAGVSGAAIKNLSLKQARDIVQFKTDLKLKNYDIIGIGGVIDTDDVDDYMNVGVDAVGSAVGIWENPYLGNEYLEIHDKQS